MASDPLLDEYLDDLWRVRALNAGTGETSFYPAIDALLNGAGDQLRPRVFCLHHPSGDAGIPDFGLFGQAQFRREETPAWGEAVMPAGRGRGQGRVARHRGAAEKPAGPGAVLAGLWPVATLLHGPAL